MLAPLGIESVGVKLYTMHWMMMLRGYADAMLARQPQLANTLPRALVDLFGVSDDAAALYPARGRSTIRNPTSRIASAAALRYG